MPGTLSLVWCRERPRFLRVEKVHALLLLVCSCLLLFLSLQIWFRINFLPHEYIIFNKMIINVHLYFDERMSWSHVTLQFDANTNCDTWQVEYLALMYWKKQNKQKQNKLKHPPKKTTAKQKTKQTDNSKITTLIIIIIISHSVLISSISHKYKMLKPTK